jgi:hypothetical protein
MALSKSPHTQDWLFRHFLMRLAGLTGVLVATAGGVLWGVGLPLVGIPLLLLGGAAVVAALVFEVQNARELVAARRGAAGSLVAAQVLLAVALLVEINLFSFFHYHRFDWTREREFSLSEDIRDQLGKLRGETTIVIHLNHNFGQLSDKRDEYDHAAERVVVDQVEDLAEQFREFGPQFRVTVLDVKDKRYRDKLKNLAENSPELSHAIQAAAEDGIFIQAQNRVQRLAFQEIFQLNKKASRTANEGRGNLVMNYQGVEPFARKVLNLDERKPRVAVAVIHEVLGTERKREDLSMSGVKKALEERGFECQDIILKKWGDMGPEPDVLTSDETRYEALDEQIDDSNRAIKGLDEQIKVLKLTLKRWQKASLKDLTKEYAEQLEVKEVTEDIREGVIKSNLEPRITLRELELAAEKRDRRAAREEQQKLNVVGLAEQRRISDLKAKFERKLADCDLLILPRMTLFNVVRGGNIPNRIHQLDPAQVTAVKDFLRKGKPVLALFGPSNEPGNVPADMFHGGADGLEGLFAELGIQFGRETVLFDVETKSFGERRGNLLIMGKQVEVPPVQFQWLPGGQADNSGLTVPRNLRPNPIAESMRLTVAGLDESQNLDLRIRHPRPVYYHPLFAPKAKTEAAFLLTDPNAWKENKPFPTDGYTPRPDFKNSGQIPIGVAVEALLPATWKPEQKTARVVAIGQGGVFIGSQLSPVREKLLLDSCNWLLGRDDLLNRESITWQYPRIGLSARGKDLWMWFTQLGIPLVFAYVGVVVLMKRALR